MEHSVLDSVLDHVSEPAFDQSLTQPPVVHQSAANQSSTNQPSARQAAVNCATGGGIAPGERTPLFLPKAGRPGDGAAPLDASSASFPFCTLANPAQETCADWRALGVEVYTGQSNEDWNAYRALYGTGRYVRKKVWETTHLTYGLRALGLLNGQTVGLGVGCGVEPMLYHLARHTARLYATDMYGFGWVSAQLDMLHHPEKYAPYDYPAERLSMLQMNATHLLMPDASVDFVYSVSSIEHFGGLRVALAHVREAARILKPGGTLAFSTEFIVQGGRGAEGLPPGLSDLFTRTTLEWLLHNSGLERIGDLSLQPDAVLLTHPAEIQLPDWTVPREHHDRLSSRLNDVIFTDVTLFLRKPI